MTEKKKKFFIRSKVWIEDEDGKVIFGLGRLRMLEAIGRHGSIQAAAKELKMSYRALWGRIKATEERLGASLLVKSIGGAAGGGSQLTPLALRLVAQFRQLNRRIAADSDGLFERAFAVQLEDVSR
ncbi:MAG: LysR family transcriptional regulator [Desulfobacterales bacterium]